MKKKSVAQLMKEAPLPSNLKLPKRTKKPSKKLAAPERKLSKREKETVTRINYEKERLKTLRMNAVSETKRQKMMEKLEKTNPVPVSFEEEEETPFVPLQLPIDPWVKTRELIYRCRSHLETKSLDLAELAFIEIKPQFKKLMLDQQRQVYDEIIDLENKIIMLRMEKVHKMLKPKRKRAKKAKRKVKRKKVKRKKTSKKKHKK